MSYPAPCGRVTPEISTGTAVSVVPLSIAGDPALS